MFVIIIVLALACGAFATPIQLNEQARIVGGRPAIDGEFPYQVSLRDSRSGQHFCGGSIISDTWILTAAYCVLNLGSNDLRVVVGTNYLQSGGQSYVVAEITSHEGYTPQNNANDIALLRISGKIQGGLGIGIIGLATDTTPIGSNLVLSGWGSISYPSTSLPNALQAINLESISVSRCKKLLPGYPIFASHLCTYMVAGKGPCQKDSGGPLVLSGLQHGIVSWGIPCATGNPDIFTSVSAFRSWIRSISGI